MKKFKEGEIYYSTLKSYPLYNIYFYNGGTYINNVSASLQNIPQGFIYEQIMY